MSYYCDYCDFQCFGTTALLKHIRSCHESEPNFLVYCHLCGLSFSKWESLRKHVQRNHADSGNILRTLICYVSIYVISTLVFTILWLSTK